MIGKVKLSDLNTHFIEKYYQTLLETPAVVNPMTKKTKSEYVYNRNDTGDSQAASATALSRQLNGN